MKEALIIVGIAAAAIAFYFLVLPRLKAAKRYDGIWRGLDGLGVPKSKAKFTSEQRTPKGAEIISTVVLPAQALSDIDAGLDEMIAYHAANWPAGVQKTGRGEKPRDFAFTFVDPMATNVETDPGSPAILVKGVQSAGTTIGCNGLQSADRDYVVLPHQAGTQWSHRNYLKASVFNEAGHAALYQANPNVFFFFTGSFDIHPFPFEQYSGPSGVNV